MRKIVLKCKAQYLRNKSLDVCIIHVFLLDSESGRNNA